MRWVNYELLIRIFKLVKKNKKKKKKKIEERNLN